MAKIVFDARMYGLSHAGIGRYIKNLLIKLAPLLNKQELILIVNQEELKEIKNDLGDQINYVLAKSDHYSFREQIEIPRLLNKINPDLVHFPHFNAPLLTNKPFVVTIHDLIKHYFHGKESTTREQWVHGIKYLGYQIQVKFALNQSQLIYVPSKFWQEKLCQDFNVNLEKIMVTYEAVDPHFIKKTKKDKNQKILEKYNLTQPFIIYTGSVYPHKNLHNLLLALKKINNLHLAVVCSRDVFVKRMEKLTQKLNLKNQVSFLGFVPDNDLIALYHQAEALVQPSLMEGFGLTGLEAMAADCPVLSSNASCLPEIYGQAAIYFNPTEPEDIAQKLNKIVNNKKLKQKLKNQGREEVKKYDWQKTAKQTFKGYQQILQKL
jgi:glycosyltransferase involved in cell wall biosynthesis